MKILYCIIFFIQRTTSRAVDTEKVEFCKNLECEQLSEKSVCGLRQEGDGFRLRLFENECELLKYGCRVKDEHAYGIINLKYCLKTFTNSRRQSDAVDKDQETSNYILGNPCDVLNCAHTSANYLCGLRQDGAGFKIRIFFNECELLKFNCENKLDFYTTDIRTCKGMHLPKEPIKTSQRRTKIKDNSNIIEDETSHSTIGHAFPQIETETTSNVTELTNEEALAQALKEIVKEDNEFATNRADDDSATNLTETTVPYETDLPIDYEDWVTNAISSSTDNVKYINNVPVPKNLIVLDGGMVNFNGNINETMDNFFAATHVFDLPVREVRKEAEILGESFRRMHMPIVGPVMVFKPWIVKPKNITEDVYHQPTLSSCYHKCPTVCPDTYAPVCGVPGIVAREPSLMFKNHCFMDAAQCKMRWDDQSPTAESSSYIETSFMICLGDSMNGLYRFLPLIRTLQHMGRLKSKGKFHYKLRNMRFISQFLAREPRPMG